MEASNDSVDFTGKLLIAMPGMGDPRFEKSVIYVCAHSAEGAMGLIINKPASDLKFAYLLKQMSIKAGEGTQNTPVYYGGPVESGRGFVLHSSDYKSNETTLQVDDQFGMTGTRDVLEDIAGGKGPANAILALGYSGWGPGQMEAELQQNGWLICDATPEIVFARDSTTKWGAALKSLGVDGLTLSAEGGRA